jgi:ribosomal protein S14
MKIFSKLIKRRFVEDDILARDNKKYKNFKFRSCKKCGEHLGRNNKYGLCRRCSMRKVNKIRIKNGRK